MCALMHLSQTPPCTYVHVQGIFGAIICRGYLVQVYYALKVFPILKIILDDIYHKYKKIFVIFHVIFVRRRLLLLSEHVGTKKNA